MTKIYVYKTPNPTYKFEISKNSCKNSLKKFMNTVSHYGEPSSYIDVCFSWEIDQRLYNSIINILKVKFTCEILNKKDDW